MWWWGDLEEAPLVTLTLVFVTLKHTSAASSALTHVPTT
jgi:hypothetical protein